MLPRKAKRAAFAAMAEAGKLKKKRPRRRVATHKRRKRK